MYNVAILGMDWFFNMTLATMDVQRSYAGIHKGYMDCMLSGFLLRVDVCVPCTHTHSLLQVKNWYVVLNGQMKLQRDSEGDKLYHVGDS